MSYKLIIRAFFFNAKTDYLPYYKNYKISVNADATAKDLLMQIQEANRDFSYPNQKLFMRINDFVVEGKQSVSEIVKRFGTSFQIDAVNSYRSNDGLKINDDDFMQSYALLEPYATDEDLKYYKSLYALHYASESEKFDREYIGDAILILAHKMIRDGSVHKKEILHAITSVNSGLFDCEYENNLFDAIDLTATIDELKAMADEENPPSLCSRIGSIFSKKETTNIKAYTSKRTAKKTDVLTAKQVGYYGGNAKATEIKEISFSKSNKLCGLGVLNKNKDLALTKAGAILLDAYDSGVEVLVVEDINALAMFRKYFSAIEKRTGREMKDLVLISADEFMAQKNSQVA
jgi:succinate dehydrogenase/fumarate reductase-like Fe-S protein